jgi:hypothetical protein
VKVTGDPLQIVSPGFEDIVTLAGKLLVTVMIIAFDVSILGLAHEELEAIIQDMVSPLIKVLVVKTGLLVPTNELPILH